jgi:hypothetical protein
MENTKTLCKSTNSKTCKTCLSKTDHRLHLAASAEDNFCSLLQHLTKNPPIRMMLEGSGMYKMNIRKGYLLVASHLVARQFCQPGCAEVDEAMA